MLCNRNQHSVVGQLYFQNKHTNKLTENSRFGVNQKWGVGGGLNEGSQKV